MTARWVGAIVVASWCVARLSAAQDPFTAEREAALQQVAWVEQARHIMLDARAQALE